MSSTILVMVEPDIQPRETVDHAAWLARLTDSRLHLLLCHADAIPHGFLVSNEARDIAAKIRAAREEILEDFAAPLREAGLDVSQEVVSERPIADGVLQKALDIDPLYVVKATKYHSQAERAVFVDTDWRLIRSCPYPLWLVKPHPIGDKPVIIAAVDPTHREDEPAALDQAIIAQAQELARKSGGSVHLLHTYAPLTGIGAEATMTFKPIRLPIDELNEKFRREHREKLDAMARACGIDSKHTHQLPGDARDVLPWFARDKDADLVVMGAVARGAIKRRLIGSTAEKVLDDLPCDILILPAGR